MLVEDMRSLVRAGDFASSHLRAASCELREKKLDK